MAIHNCPHCGAIIPYAGARCSYCEQKRANEKKQGKSGTSVGNYSGCLAAYAGFLLKVLKWFAILLAISAVIWGILFFVFDTEKIDYKVTNEASRTAEQFEDYLFDLDNKRDVWEIKYEKKNTSIFGRLAFWDKSSYTIRYNKGETTSHITFIFEGENLGTGLLDGTYILTKIDGVDVLIDANNKLIYKMDSEFYLNYALKLQTITHDALLGKIFEQIRDGEHGLVETDPPMEAIFTENAAITARLVRNNHNELMDSGFEARSRIGDSDVWDVYKFTYYYSNSIKDLKIDDYSYAK